MDGRKGGKKTGKNSTGVRKNDVREGKEKE
jgi:hypothetical protein